MTREDLIYERAGEIYDESRYKNEKRFMYLTEKQQEYYLTEAEEQLSNEDAFARFDDDDDDDDRYRYFDDFGRKQKFWDSGERTLDDEIIYVNEDGEKTI